MLTDRLVDNGDLYTQYTIQLIYVHTQYHIHVPCMSKSLWDSRKPSIVFYKQSVIIF